MKNNIVACIVLSIAGHSLKAAIEFREGEVSQAKTLGLGQGYKDTGIGFELFNKSNIPIWVALKNGGDFTPNAKLIKLWAGDKVPVARVNIDIKKDTLMAIWLRDPGRISLERKFLVVGTPQWLPTPDKIYSFKPNKTIYITWDKGNFPRPQTGPLKGLLRQTETGLSLSNNISAKEIELKFSK